MAKFEPKNYYITAAQAYGELNHDFLKSSETFVKDKKAEFIVLPMNGRTQAESRLDILDTLPQLKDHLLFKAETLNEHIGISDIKVPPQNVDPSTGRGRFIAKDKTLIVPHAKQRFRAFPNSNYDLPKIFLTPGAITFPNYNRENNKGDVAARDHAYGAIYVEIVNDKIFHFRNIRALRNGKFVDLGKMYDGDKITKSPLEAMVLGDWHEGDTNPQIREVTYEMINELKPSRIFIHDLFTGYSVNHHNKEKIVDRVLDFDRYGNKTLTGELQDCCKTLMELNEIMKGKEIYIVASNHNEFLLRYLQEVRFVNDLSNTKLAAKLLYEAFQGKDPLKEGLLEVGKKLPKNIIFLERDEDCKIFGYQLGTHGDKGMNGGKGSMRSREFAAGKSITGHAHTPEILRDTYVVGTSTYLNLPYTKGSASSWMNTHALLYGLTPRDGAVQLVNIINGKWRK